MEDSGYCNKCRGVKTVVLGLLVLLNAFWWPMWTGVDGWAAFFGALLVVKGLMCVVKPYCCCPRVCPAPKKKK